MTESSFTPALTSILVCRLVINLQKQPPHSRDGRGGTDIPLSVFGSRTLGSGTLTSVAAILNREFEVPPEFEMVTGRDSSHDHCDVVQHRRITP